MHKGICATSLVAMLVLSNISNAADERANLPTAPADIRPLLIGSKLPDVTLKGIDEKSHSLANDKPTVVIFYRGGW